MNCFLSKIIENSFVQYSLQETDLKKRKKCQKSTKFVNLGNYTLLEDKLKPLSFTNIWKFRRYLKSFAFKHDFPSPELIWLTKPHFFHSLQPPKLLPTFCRLKHVELISNISIKALFSHEHPLDPVEIAII